MSGKEHFLIHLLRWIYFMLEDVDEFLMCRLYVSIWALVVGRFVKSSRPIFCDSLTRIITTKWLFLTPFSASTPIVTPIISPILYIWGLFPTPNRWDTWVGHIKRGPQTKMFSPYPGCQKVQSALAELFWSLDKGGIWWYNIFGDIKGTISHILRIDPITEGSTLITGT